MKLKLFILVLIGIIGYFGYNKLNDVLRHTKIDNNKQLLAYLHNKFPLQRSQIKLSIDYNKDEYIQFMYIEKDPNQSKSDLFKEFITTSILIINDNKVKLKDLRGVSAVVLDKDLKNPSSAILGIDFINSLNYDLIEKDKFKYIESQIKEKCPKSDPLELKSFCTLKL